MMTDASVVEWAAGWLREDTLDDPTFRQRFLDALASELKGRREHLSAAVQVIEGFKPLAQAVGSHLAECPPAVREAFRGIADMVADANAEERTARAWRRRLR